MSKVEVQSKEPARVAPPLVRAVLGPLAKVGMAGSLVGGTLAAAKHVEAEVKGPLPISAPADIQPEAGAFSFQGGDEDKPIQVPTQTPEPGEDQPGAAPFPLYQIVLADLPAGIDFSDGLGSEEKQQLAENAPEFAAFVTNFQKEVEALAEASNLSTEAFATQYAATQNEQGETMVALWTVYQGPDQNIVLLPHQTAAGLQLQPFALPPGQEQEAAGVSIEVGMLHFTSGVTGQESIIPVFLYTYDDGRTDQFVPNNSLTSMQPYAVKPNDLLANVRLERPETAGYVFNETDQFRLEYQAGLAKPVLVITSANGVEQRFQTTALKGRAGEMDLGLHTNAPPYPDYEVVGFYLDGGTAVDEATGYEVTFVNVLLPMPDGRLYVISAKAHASVPLGITYDAQTNSVVEPAEQALQRFQTGDKVNLDFRALENQNLTHESLKQDLIKFGLCGSDCEDIIDFILGSQTSATSMYNAITAHSVEGQTIEVRDSMIFITYNE